MEILISEQVQSETNTTGYSVTYINRNKKKTINDTDFFPNGSDIETKIQQLRKLLKNYFDAQV